MSDTSVAGFYQEQDFVSLFHGQSRLMRHQVIKILFFTAQSTRVDHDKSLFGTFSDAILSVTGKPGLVRNYRVPASGKHVKKCGLADIWPTDQRDDRDHFTSCTEERKPSLSSVNTDDSQTIGCT